MIFSSHAIFSLFGNIFANLGSNRFGRKPILLISIFGSTLATVLLGFADSVITIVAARSLAGLFCGTVKKGKSI